MRTYITAANKLHSNYSLQSNKTVIHIFKRIIAAQFFKRHVSNCGCQNQLFSDVMFYFQRIITFVELWCFKLKVETHVLNNTPIKMEELKIGGNRNKWNEDDTKVWSSVLGFFEPNTWQLFTSCYLPFCVCISICWVIILA